MKRLKYEDVKLYIESQGYTLLSDRYDGSKSKNIEKILDKKLTILKETSTTK